MNISRIYQQKFDYYSRDKYGHIMQRDANGNIAMTKKNFKVMVEFKGFENKVTKAEEEAFEMIK